MYITDLTKRVENVPGSKAGQAVIIRKLTRKQLRAARQAKQADSVETMKTFGGPAFLRELQGLGDPAALKKAADEQAEKAKSDVLAEFDADTVLEKGVINFDPLPMFKREDAIERLREDAAEYIAREIITFTRQAEDEATEKND